MNVAEHARLGLATRHSMSFFGHTLERLMQDREVNQLELSKRSGVGQGQISRYINEGTIPESDTVGKFSVIFEGDAEQELWAAWLKDQTPSDLRSKILVMTGAGASFSTAPKKPGDFDLQQLPPIRRNLVIRIAKALEKNPKIARLLEEVLSVTDSEP
jgi:hypothetical protein